MKWGGTDSKWGGRAPLAPRWRRPGFRLQSTPTGSGPKFVQRPDGVTTSPTPLGTVLVWSQKNYLRFLLIVRFSKSSYGCCHRRNRTFRYDGFRLSHFGPGSFGLAVSVWGHFSHDTSVHKQLIAIVYLNDYIGRRNVTLAGVREVMIVIKSELQL